MLSKETTTNFRAALREHCAEPVADGSTITPAVSDAAAAARAHGMSAEQFVIWVKKIWDEVMGEGRLDHSADPARVRDDVISAAIKAYYVQ